MSHTEVAGETIFFGLRLAPSTNSVAAEKSDFLDKSRKAACRFPSLALKAIVLAVVLISGLKAASPEDVRHRYITIGTGSASGVYLAVGKAICGAVNRHAERRGRMGDEIVTYCRAGPSGGSAFNIRQVSSGAFTFVIAQANDLDAAVNGIDPDRIVTVPDLRSVVALHPEILHIVVRPDTDIGGVADFVDKRISAGNLGSGTRLLAQELVEAYGLSDEDFDPAEHLTLELQADALCTGQVDAFVTMNAVPAPNVFQAANDCNAKLLPIRGSQVESMLADSASLVEAVIPANSYPTIDVPIQSIGVRAELVTREAIPDAIVRDVVTAIVEDLPSIRAAHKSLSTLQPREIVPDGNGAPLHEGARQYFSERGWQ